MQRLVRHIQLRRLNAWLSARKTLVYRSKSALKGSVLLYDALSLQCPADNDSVARTCLRV